MPDTASLELVIPQNHRFFIGFQEVGDWIDGSGTVVKGGAGHVHPTVLRFCARFDSMKDGTALGVEQLNGFGCTGDQEPLLVLLVIRGRQDLGDSGDSGYKVKSQIG